MHIARTENVNIENIKINKYHYSTSCNCQCDVFILTNACSYNLGRLMYFYDKKKTIRINSFYFPKSLCTPYPTLRSKLHKIKKCIFLINYKIRLHNRSCTNKRNSFKSISITLKKIVL